jgi:SAM-dependent methyltransferase
MTDANQSRASFFEKRQRKSWNYIKRYCPEYISKSKRFAELIMPYLGSHVEMIDIGCGRGLETAVVYKDHTRYCIGLDISESIFQNQTIHKALVGSAYAIPLPEACVDLAISQELLEHLEFPQKMFDEVSRILRPKGIFAIMTPNLWFPSTIVSWLTPYSFHKFATRILHNTEAADVFPTWYRANTFTQLQKLGRHARLEITSYEYFQCNPGQISFSPLLTRLEVAYFWLITHYQILGFLRDIIVVFFRKPASKDD